MQFNSIMARKEQIRNLERHRASSRIAHYLLVVILLCLAPLRTVVAGPIWLLSSHAGGDYQQVVDAFVQGLAASEKTLDVRVINVENESSALGLDKHGPVPELIVAIGSDAARLAVATPTTIPVLNVLIPRLLYEQLYLRPNGTSRPTQRSALYLDQPLQRQLDLCRVIVPNLHQVAVLFGPVSRLSADAWETAARKLSITLTSRVVAPGSRINADLDAVLDGSQLLLAVPDPDVFNGYTVSGLLLTAYHHDVPVIGFSAAYVKAGALSAVYSTPEQVGREAAAAVLQARTDIGWALAPPRYGSLYSIALNHQVARSLNLKIPNEDELLRKLQALERIKDE